jgi:predicted nucleic acid-binding protein
MIVLDTNVVSEPLKPEPDPTVLEWLDQQEPATLYLTSINLAELFAGIEILPTGRRKTSLRNALTRKVLPLFGERVLSFDAAAAEVFARIHSRAAAAGHTVGFADGAIAAIASANGCIVATRNVRDFKGTGVEVVNPWDTKGG